MPDILIRGMDMPENCGECFLSSLGRCKVAGKEIVLWQTNRKDDRPLFCHLYELPPHGDLIDRAEVLETVMQYAPDDDGSCSKANTDLRELLDDIENEPAIVPANK